MILKIHFVSRRCEAKCFAHVLKSVRSASFSFHALIYSCLIQHHFQLLLLRMFIQMLKIRSTSRRCSTQGGE